MNFSKNIAEHYDTISDRFDISRVRIWNNVKKFITNTDINKNKLLLDAGCGNGKNSVYALDYNYNIIGIDISTKLLEISQKKGLTVYNKDLLELNYIDLFDKCICIAVIHHINSLDLQCEAIINMINSLKKNRELLISVWSHEKINILENEEEIQKTKKDYRDFVIGHNYIDWIIDKKKNEVSKRYYYIHDYKSFVNLIEMVNNIIKIKYEISWEKQNWFCKIIKI